MSSPDLISAIQKNDITAKKEVFHLYYGKLAAIANRYCKNQQQAEEVLNLGFNSCFEKLQNMRNSKVPTLDTFFEKEFILECVAYVKSIRSEYYVSSTVYATDNATSKNYNLFENNEVIDFNHLDTETLVRSLQQMVPSQRLIFNLHVIEGHSLSEAAAILESSEETVKSNLEKARFNFQKNIEKSLKQIKA
ncbi:RNA polymerase sigma factor [Aurantibacillus circumpalustris]|uniref:RNA polymerase sigma factor n=1 Tax=Aurantibacillus circumpalustris TaxID=3036359 RepID=UPI00295BA140|nr:sigma-70 family RNA polymerase sigma factor [Aurantibacillus circumpalustris]